MEDALSMVYDDEPVSTLPPLAVRASVDPEAGDTILPNATLSVVMHRFPTLLEMSSLSRPSSLTKRMEAVVRTILSLCVFSGLASQNEFGRALGL